MMVIFATIVVDAERRAEIAADMVDQLEQLAPKDHGAIHFELLLSASDPSKIHVFQTWDNEAVFHEWEQVDIHREFQMRFGQVATEASSVQFVGCAQRPG